MLLDYTDYERQTNSSLSDPDGRNLANAIANAILAWSARYCNRLTWAYGTQTEYFSPDDYATQFYVSALPVDTAQTVGVATYDAANTAYNAYTGTVRSRANGTITTASFQFYGIESVRINYTGGYIDNTFPLDLKQALTDLLVQRFNDAMSGGKVVSSVKAIDYQETYDLKGADIPGDAMEVLDSYRLPVVY